MRLALWATVGLQILRVQAQNATLGLQDGLISFNTSEFIVHLVKDSQTVYSLQPKDSPSGFDFIPSDQMVLRQYNGNYHLGDITFRARAIGTVPWTSGDSSISRRPVIAQTPSGPTLALANLSPTLPADTLLNITRRWASNNGSLELLFDVNNPQDVSVEIGALGAPLEFNNVSDFCLLQAFPSAEVLADFHQPHLH